MNNKKAPLYILVGILFIASIFLNVVNKNHFEQSSILFIGLPAIIALLTIKFYPKPQTSYGIVFKIITLFLILSGILWGEGIICILMAAPIFYAVGGIIVFIYQLFEKHDKSKLSTLVIVPMMLFMAQPAKHFKENEIITAKSSKAFDKIVSINHFSKSPNFKNELPQFFKLGFPSPNKIVGEDLNIGAKREIIFESMTKGEGNLKLEIVELEENHIRFRPIEDSTHIAHWLTWKDIEVTIEEKNGQSVVHWSTSFSCDLHPKWYFSPIEEFSVDLMNEHLMNSYFE